MLLQENHYPGVRIFKFQSPLCFINCNIFRQQLEEACNISTNGNVDWDTEGCIQTLLYKVNDFAKSIFLYYSNSLM